MLFLHLCYRTTFVPILFITRTITENTGANVSKFKDLKEFIFVLSIIDLHKQTKACVISEDTLVLPKKVEGIAPVLQRCNCVQVIA